MNPSYNNVMKNTDFQTWYDSLIKPSWTPSPGVISTIWTILYPIIIAVNVIVISKLVQKQISFAVALPFIINLIANIAFTPIQFGLRNLDMAAVDIVLVLLTIIWAMVAIWPHSRVLAVAFVPYLIWVSLATVLQISITVKN